MSNEFLKEEKGGIPFTALGIVMLLIAAVGVYHFNKLDETRVEQRTTRRADMETFYGLAQTVFDIQQEAREAAEETLLRDSVETYARPISVDGWHENGTYQAWRAELAKKISGEVKREIVGYYNSNGSYSDAGVEYDFSNFLGDNGSTFIDVAVVPDESWRKMALNISIDPTRHVKAKKGETGFSLGMRGDTLVVVDARPYTMSKAVYDFTGIFKKSSRNVWDFNASRDTVDEFAWYIWAVEEVLGLLEANLRHDVRFATDERVTYSLAHMIVAYKEKQHFGTYDYLHVVREILRPWLGDEDGGREFLGLLKRGVESGYVDQAIGMMESGVLLANLNSYSWKVNNNILRVVARLDSSLVNPENFPRDYIPGGGLIPGRGAVQQLRAARDVSSIEAAENDLRSTRSGITEAASDPGLYQSQWSSSLSRHRGEVRREYREFTEEIDNAVASVGSAVSEMGYVTNSLAAIEDALNESKCSSIIASQLWYGSIGEGGEGTKGLEDVLPIKRDEGGNLSRGLSHLKGTIGELRYQNAEGDIDEKYELASDEMRRAGDALNGASTYRGYFYSCRETWDTSRSAPTSGCEESRVVEEEYDCGTEKKPATCTRSLREYRCTCKDYYRREYGERMSRASYAFLSAAEELRALGSSIAKWFEEHGYEDALNELSVIHGYRTGRGLMDFYYNHYKTSLPDQRGYVGALEYALNLSEPRANSTPRSALSFRTGDVAGEVFVVYGYGFVHTTLTGLYSAFNPGGANIEYDKARDALKTMRKDGFFDFLLELITAISDLLNYFGDILSMLSAIDREYASFPLLRDHLYASFPLPPIGQSSKGFSLLHDIRMRADNHPAVLEFSLPLIGKRRIALPPREGQMGGRGYSIPVPFTPLYIYAWGFDIARSQVGSEPLSKEAVGEKSTLWLIDYENQGNLAPLAMMKLGNKTLPTPVYLHRPLMYKYDFTVGDFAGPAGGIAKGFKPGKLPPVIVVALGPFATKFRGWVEPPDAGGRYVAVDVAIKESGDSIAITAKLPPEAERFEGVFLLRVYESGGISNDSPWSRELKGSLDKMPLELVVKKTDLLQLKTHGWSLVNADLYALDEIANSSGSDLLDHVIGEDHANLPIVDPALKVDVRIAGYDGESIALANNGNRRVEVVLTATDGCCFFKESNSWERGLWTGSLAADGEMKVSIRPVGPVSLDLKTEMPIEVQRLIQNSTGVHLHDQYKLR